VKRLFIRLSDTEETSALDWQKSFDNVRETADHWYQLQESQPRNQRTLEVYQDMLRFAVHLSTMSKLRSIRLEMSLQFHASVSQERLWAQSMSTILLSLPQSLSSLTLDNCGGPRDPASPWDEENHLCPLFLTTGSMPSLRHLRIRARNLCSDLFPVAGLSPPSKVETIIINMSIRIKKQCTSRTYHTKFCCVLDEHGRDPYSHLVGVAKAVSMHLPLLK
jgi:hypothetical protein